MPAEPASADPAPERLELRRLATGDGHASFAQDVAMGLTAEPKVLRPKYFYDALGSYLFEAICLLPEYYLTRAESEILQRSADEIAGALGGRLRMAELGSGSSVKTRYLIEALLRRQGELHYLPVDISSSAIERSAQELLGAYPGLSITAYAADYSGALDAWIEERRQGAVPPEVRTLVLFLGSTIGNLEPAAAVDLLRQIRGGLGVGDGLLLGADLKKPEEILLRAYDDSLGVTAAFNLNLLVRINRELGGHFDVSRFRHEARWNPDAGRVEMHLVSTEAQEVAIDELGLSVSFADGESIHTESSHKFDLEQLGELARPAGFEVARSWLDADGWFSLDLLVARDEG